MGTESAVADKSYAKENTAAEEMLACAHELLASFEIDHKEKDSVTPETKPLSRNNRIEGSVRRSR